MGGLTHTTLGQPVRGDTGVAVAWEAWPACCRCDTPWQPGGVMATQAPCMWGVNQTVCMCACVSAQVLSACRRQACAPSPVPSSMPAGGRWVGPRCIQLWTGCQQGGVNKWACSLDARKAVPNHTKQQHWRAATAMPGLIQPWRPSIPTVLSPVALSVSNMCLALRVPPPRRRRFCRPH